jgi:hypothetical protein
MVPTLMSIYEVPQEAASVVFEFPKKPNTTLNLTCRRAKRVRQAFFHGRAILGARVRVSSYSGEWMEVTSRTLLPFCALFHVNVNTIVY